MGIHIEIQADAATPREFEALAAFIDVMRGVEMAAPLVVSTHSGGAAIATVADTSMPTLPSAVAAASTSPTIPAPPEGVEIDNTGLPWDVRIHASTKATNADGSWRTKRGVDPALAAIVTAEIRSVMAAPGAPLSPPVAETAPAVVDPAVAFAAPPPPPVAETVADPAPAPMAEFPRIMKIITEKQAAGLVTTELVRGIAVQLGLTGVADLAKRPDLVPAFEAMLP